MVSRIANRARRNHLPDDSGKPDGCWLNKTNRRRVSNAPNRQLSVWQFKNFTCDCFVQIDRECARPGPNFRFDAKTSEFLAGSHDRSSNDESNFPRVTDTVTKTPYVNCHVSIVVDKHRDRLPRARSHPPKSKLIEITSNSSRAATRAREKDDLAREMDGRATASQFHRIAENRQIASAPR